MSYVYLISFACLQQLPQLSLLLKFLKTTDWLLRRVIFSMLFVHSAYQILSKLSTIYDFFILSVELHLCRDHDFNCWYEGWFKGATNPKSKGMIMIHECTAVYKTFIWSGSLQKGVLKHLSSSFKHYICNALVNRAKKIGFTSDMCMCVFLTCVNWLLITRSCSQGKWLDKLSVGYGVFHLICMPNI